MNAVSNGYYFKEVNNQCLWQQKWRFIQKKYRTCFVEKVCLCALASIIGTLNPLLIAENGFPPARE